MTTKHPDWRENPDFFRECGRKGGKARKRPHRFDSESARKAVEIREAKRRAEALKVGQK